MGGWVEVPFPQVRSILKILVVLVKSSWISLAQTGFVPLTVVQQCCSLYLTMAYYFCLF